MRKKLILLDLDHTLIYGSYAETETTNKLFKFNNYLSVYERPLARELVLICQEKGDIIIYTTALKTYAKKISKSLEINPIQILSRKDCTKKNDSFKKTINPEWIINYDEIIIIDDSPNVWLNSPDSIKFFVPMEFRGDAQDLELQSIIEKVRML
jgi:TFIIF-interacting CTD phosphatase-like protein